MRYSYEFARAANEEYKDAVQWYSEKSLSAAENFIESVEHAIILICEHPERWRNLYKHFYELNVKKYPYNIIYSIEEELISIQSIYHHSRNPKKKYKK